MSRKSSALRSPNVFVLLWLVLVGWLLQMPNADAAFGAAEASDTPATIAQVHDVGVSGCVGEGPAAVNLSDTAGATMYIACDATNLSDHDDAVVLTSATKLLTSTLPEGCTTSGSLLIPGRTDFVLLAGEAKRVLYRVKFECHSPAVPSATPLTIRVGIGHVTQPDGLDDMDPANNSRTFADTMIIGPGPTAPPTPPADGDGDGYMDAAESQIGTRADAACGGDGWPSDLVPGDLSFNTLDLQDLTSFVAPVRRLNTSPGDPGFSARWDLVPGTTVGDQINPVDLAALVSGTSGYPPMFSGQRAFGRTCPFSP